MTDYEVVLAQEEREERTGIKDPVPPPPEIWKVGILIAALVAAIMWIMGHGVTV